MMREIEMRHFLWSYNNKSVFPFVLLISVYSSWFMDVLSYLYISLCCVIFLLRKQMLICSCISLTQKISYVNKETNSVLINVRSWKVMWDSFVNFIQGDLPCSGTRSAIYHKRNVRLQHTVRVCAAPVKLPHKTWGWRHRLQHSNNKLDREQDREVL